MLKLTSIFAVVLALVSTGMVPSVQAGHHHKHQLHKKLHEHHQAHAHKKRMKHAMKDACKSQKEHHHLLHHHKNGG